MRIAIMQPTYLPWLGYFDLIDQVDLFVFLDNVQFSKQSWQQRNRIKTRKGLEWLTVPILLRGRFGQLIQEVEIRDPEFWTKHVRALEVNYGKAPCFHDYLPALLSIYKEGSPWIRLVNLNAKLIEWLCAVIGVKTPSVHSSSLKTNGQQSARLIAICKSLGATEYLSPIGAAGYLLENIQEFENQGIQVLFHNYKHPIYDQLFPRFQPFASVIDLVFNEGPRSLKIVRSGRKVSYLPEEVRAHGIVGVQGNDQNF